ncbi:MAG: ribosome maturation factor RimM [Bacteroidota bacterium]
MKPPICAICRKRFAPRTGGNLVYFKLTEEEQEKLDRMKARRIIGHPPGRVWFCSDHYDAAMALKHLSAREALRQMKNPKPEAPAASEPTESTSESLIEVGQLKKPHGVNGEIRLMIKDQYLEDVLQCDILFVEIKGKPLPYFVDSFRESGQLLIRFEDIETPEAARPLNGKKILIRQSDVLEDAKRQMVASDELEYARCVGYEMIDLEKGPLATIRAVEAFPQQEMAVIDYDGRELFIPLHADLIERIDEAARQITVKLPEGLLEL